MPQARLFLTVSAGRLQWCTENLLNAKPYRDELARTARDLFPKQADGSPTADAGLAFWRPDTAPNQPNNHNAIACALLLNRPDPIQQARNAGYLYILILSEQDYRTHPLNPVALLRTILTPELLEPTFPHNAPADKKRQAVENNERITIIDNIYSNFQPVATQQTPQLDLIQSAAGSELENVQTYLAACIAQPTKVPPLCFSPIGNAANAAADFLHQPSAKLLETLYLCLPVCLWTNLRFSWSICQHGPQFNKALNQAVQPIHSNPPNELTAVMQNYVKPLFSALAQRNFSEVDKLRHSYIPNSPNTNAKKPVLEDKAQIINQLKEKIEARPLTEIVAQRQGSDLPQQRASIIYNNTEPNDSNTADFFKRRAFIWMGISTLLIIITALLAFYVGTFYGSGGNKQPDTLSLVKNGFTSTFTLPNQENVANETDPKQLGKMLGQMAKTQAEQLNNLSAAVKNQPNEENRLVEEFRHAFRGAYQTNKYDYNKALNAATIAELGQQFGELSKKKDTEITALNGKIQTLSNNLTQKTAKLAELKGTVKQHKGTIAKQTSDLTQKTAEVAELQDTVKQREDTITQLTSNLTQKTDKVAELESIVKQKTDKVAELKGTVKQHKGTIAKQTSDLTQKTAEVAELQDTVKQREDTITQLTSNLTQKTDKVAELESIVKQKTAKVAELESTVKLKTAKVAELEGIVKQKTDKVAELESTVKLKTAKVAELESTVKLKTDKVAELESTVKLKTNKVAELESTVKLKTNKVAELESTVKLKTNKVAELESTVKLKTDKVTELESTVEQKKGTIATQTYQLAQKGIEVRQKSRTITKLNGVISDISHALERYDYKSVRQKIADMAQPKPCSDSYCYGYQDGYQDGYGYNDKAIQESCSHFYCKGYNDGYYDSKKLSRNF
jgi:predicted RNase H-like nuclease (RuvC/YqgF family)